MLADTFEGLGCITGVTHHIKLDPSSTPEILYHQHSRWSVLSRNRHHLRPSLFNSDCQSETTSCDSASSSDDEEGQDLEQAQHREAESERHPGRENAPRTENITSPPAPPCHSQVPPMHRTSPFTKGILLAPTVMLIHTPCDSETIHL